MISEYGISTASPTIDGQSTSSPHGAMKSSPHDPSPKTTNNISQPITPNQYENVPPASLPASLPVSLSPCTPITRPSQPNPLPPPPLHFLRSVYFVGGVSDFSRLRGGRECPGESSELLLAGECSQFDGCVGSV
jgi:hypothetical protein